MNPIESLLSEPFGQALGWTLLHFVWQGTLLALLLALALYGLRRHTAQVRYVVACGAMGVLLALPAFTLYMLLLEPVETPVENLTPAVAASPTAAAEATPEAGAASLDAPPSWPHRAASMLRAALPWLVLLWMAGVLALSVRYLAGWTYTVRLRRRGARDVGQRWRDQLTRLKQQLGVRRAVRLVSSALVQVPTVAGWLRPVILLPVSVFTRLSPRQIEMIIAHELAHIRRHDYLVNLLQAACETVLFYHPAVWWVSARIRIEREHCCDDVVVSVCGDAFTYAAALAKLETARQTTPRLALAASGGSLLDRVRRLLEGPAEATPGAARWLVGLAVLATLLLSLRLSTTVDDVWNKTRVWIAGNETSAFQQQRLLKLPGSYERTALLFERFIFEDQSVSAQLEALDEVRKLPKRAALPPLINLAERHPQTHVRLEAVQWLGRLGDAYVVFSLERIAFEDGNTAVQMEALDALRNLSEKLGVPSLIKIAQTHPRPAMRSEATQWLGRLGDEAARVTLERILVNDANSAVQREAFDALLKLPDGLDLQTLLKLSQLHPNVDIRREAKEQTRNRHFVSNLNLRQREALVRRQHALSMPNPYQSTARRLEALIFADESEATHLQALQALTNLPGDAPLPSLKKIARTHPNEVIRNKATRHVAEVETRVQATHEKDRQWSQALEDVKHDQPSRRVEAVKILEELPTNKVISVLADVAFNDPSLDVQLEALDALRDRGGLEAMARLAQIIRTHPSLAMRVEAVQSIDEMKAEDRLPLLEEVIFRDDDLDVRMEALDQLIDAPEAGAVPILENIAARQSLLEALRLEATEALEER